MTLTKFPDKERLRRWRVVIGVCLASVAMPMTFTGPAVALRDIARDLGGEPIALAWVTNAFMLAFGSMLMAAGALADRHGRRRTFLAGVLAFIVVSLAALAAPNILVFDLLRSLQGAASAAVFAGGAASMANEFEGPVRLRAFSLLGTSFGIGLTLGPVAAGAVIASLGWRGIFALVAGTAVIAFAVAAPAFRESRDPDAQAFDLPGAAAFTTALTLFTYGVLQAPASGWASPTTLVALFGATLLLTAFVRIEQRSRRPMLDLTLLRYPRFVGVQLLAAAPAYGFVVLLILLPIRFVGIEGLSTAETGRWMMFLSAPLVVLPLLAGQMARRVAPATLCGGGLLLAAAGLAWLGLAGPGSAVLLPMAVIGIGISLPWGLMDGLAVSVVPKERAGMATGIFSTTRVAGEGLALAIVGAALAALIVPRLTSMGVPTGALAAAIAQQLVAGDPGSAAALWPALPMADMVRCFRSAFSSLALVLSGITAVTATVVFAVLGREGPCQRGGDAQEGLQDTVCKS